MEKTDEELVLACRAGDNEACEVLFESYKPLVRSRAVNKFLLGGDFDDLIQEGMIGLLAAVREYDPEKAGFSTFASVCIDRQLNHAIESAQSKKNRILSESVPIDEADMSRTTGGANPEKMVLAEERRRETLDAIRGSLSRLELLVLNLVLRGYSSREIAEMMGKSPKQIDNAFQRIRRKTKKALEGKDKKVV